MEYWASKVVLFSLVYSMELLTVQKWLLFGRKHAYHSLLAHVGQVRTISARNHVAN
jgi:hypothetical protein